jgi:mannan endo-1,4-beta-mannosidase
VRRFAFAWAAGLACCQLFPNLDGLATVGPSDADGVDDIVDVADASPDGGQDGGIARPAYNKGTGFFVLNGKLYDANAVEFRIRGIDKVHWDNGVQGLTGTSANTVRWAIDFTQPAANNVALLEGSASSPAGTVYDRTVVMPTPLAALACSTDPAVLNAAVSAWVAQASSWTTLERYSILSLAENWGPPSSSVWRDDNISAIQSLRAAGYHATISVSTGGCGQDLVDLASYAADVLNGDPEKNVIFDVHVYGAFPDVGALGKAAATLSGLGVPIFFGELGPGRDIGPSPTNLPPQEIIQTAEQYDIGWMAWAWDDDNLTGAQADNTWFALSYESDYQSSADLTLFGQQVVEGCMNAAPGGCGCPDTPVPAMTVVEPGCQGTPAPVYSGYSLKALAKPASIFTDGGAP